MIPRRAARRVRETPSGTVMDAPWKRVGEVKRWRSWYLMPLRPMEESTSVRIYAGHGQLSFRGREGGRYRVGSAVALD